MATTLTGHRKAPRETALNDDPFHDPLIGGIGLAFVLMGVAILLLTGLIHWGVEYQTPSWNAHSYPPPIVHRW